MAWVALVFAGAVHAAEPDPRLGWFEEGRQAYETCEAEHAAGRRDAALAACRTSYARMTQALTPDNGAVRLARGAVVGLLDELGRPDEAAQVLADAIDTQGAALEGYPALRWTDLMDLVKRWAEAGRLNEAQPYAEQALAVVEADEQALPAGSRAVTLQSLGFLAHESGRYAVAESHRREVVRQVVAAGAAADAGWLPRALTDLGNTLQQMGREDEAQRVHREAVAAAERPGVDTPARMGALNALGVTLTNQAEYVSAEDAYRRALALAPSSDLQRIYVLKNLGALLLLMDQVDEAEQATRKALEAAESGWGPLHPATLTAVEDLALVMEHRGRFAEALTLHRRSLAGSQQVLRPGHPTTALRANNLAVLLERLGDRDEAISLLERSLADARSAYGPVHPTVATRQTSLAQLLSNRGDFPRAEPLFRDALQQLEQTRGPDHP
ncbi:MAG: tetratricopeptide repeat protein, partial [Myxococcota bacterium]